MSARFIVDNSRYHGNGGVGVLDRKFGREVAVAINAKWAEVIADGLNMIVDQVTPLVPSVQFVDVLDGEVIDDHDEQKAIGWHDEPLSSL